MYNIIYDIKNNKTVDINSKRGKHILKNYLKSLIGGSQLTLNESYEVKRYKLDDCFKFFNEVINDKDKMKLYRHDKGLYLSYKKKSTENPVEPEEELNKIHIVIPGDFTVLEEEQVNKIMNLFIDDLRHYKLNIKIPDLRSFLVALKRQYTDVNPKTYPKIKEKMFNILLKKLNLNCIVD